MSDVYTLQRNEAHCAMLQTWSFPMRMPVDLQQALFEDPNVYQIYITDPPGAQLWCNGWKVDYMPALTYERAVKYAEGL